MVRGSWCVFGLFFLLLVGGCSPYLEDFQYVPRPAVAEVRATSQQQPPAATSLVSVIGVRREDRKQALPESIEVRMRLENNGAEDLVFDPRTLDLADGQMLPFPPPIVRPPGPVAIPPAQSETLTAFFPLAQPPHEQGAFDLLNLRWIVRVGGQNVRQSVNFRRVFPRVYYYGPYWGYPYWDYPPCFWYGGVVFIHRR